MKSGKKTKKVVKTWKKVLLFILAQSMLVTSVLLAFNVLAGSQVLIRTQHGLSTYHIDPFEKKVAFEDSYIYQTMLEEAINDIAVLSVVRKQMESGGNFYGRKQIDITDYAYRRDRESKSDVTAVFYLEDLLKWYKYGLIYEQQPVRIDNWQLSEEEVILEEENGQWTATEYAYPNQSVPSSHSGDGNGYYNPEFWMKQSINYYTQYANFSDIYTDAETGETYGNLNVLKCRYQTVDGKNLEELVNNWEDYFTLVHNLDVAMTNLAVNYDLYQELSSVYGEGKSNIKYCMFMTTKGVGNRQYLSNIPEYDNMNVLPEQAPPITKEFKEKFGQYIYYYFAEMKYETNTALDESVLFDIMTGRQLEYAYPENTKFWIGIDTDYPVQDAFSVAREKYYNSTIPAVEYLTAAGILLLLYIILMIFLCCKAGWKKEENGEAVLQIHFFDKIHTEFLIAFTAGLGVLTYLLWMVLISGLDTLLFNNWRLEANLFLAAAVFISAIVWGGLLLSYVRRIKSHNLWTDSLLGKGCYKIKKSWEKSILENRHAAMRNWGTYLIYLCVNFILVAAAFYVMQSMILMSFILILTAFAFDVWVGFMIIRNRNERYHIIDGINRIRDGEIHHQVKEEMHGENQVLKEAVNNIGDGIRKAVETSMKDERLKADLITNVSHDIKTPLTSIINYVDLLKRENIQDETVKGYIEILDSKSQRLKQLTEDLVEASKISSGNISYVFERINLAELVNQAIGEFSEKFENKGLTLVENLTGQSAYIEADSRRMWRVVENLFNNICKYAMPNTRIYLSMTTETVEEVEQVSLSVKNISQQPLNIDASELTERFIRGDVSRSTEGSGLGLSIAKNLTEAQHGKFEIYLDGDLFKVTLTFPMLEKV